jgi:hypothetical protein
MYSLVRHISVDCTTRLVLSEMAQPTKSGSNRGLSCRLRVKDLYFVAFQKFKVSCGCRAVEGERAERVSLTNDA